MTGGWGADDWIAVAGIGQVVVLLLAALFARRQVAEARRLRRPYVIAYGDLSPVSRVLINIVIENVGRSPAYDTTVTFAPPLTSTTVPKTEASWSAVVDGIPFLAPDQKMTHLLDSAISMYNQRDTVTTKYTVTVVSHDRAELTERPWWAFKRREFTETYAIDLRVWFGSHYTEEKTVHHATKALEAMERPLNELARIARGLKVYIGDEEKEAAEEEERLEQRRAAHQELVDRLTPSEPQEDSDSGPDLKLDAEEGPETQPEPDADE